MSTTSVRPGARDASVDAPVSAARAAELTALIRSTTGEARTTSTPFTGEALAEVPVSSLDDVDAAFDAGRAIQPRWASTSVRDRAGMLLRLFEALQ